jgi:ParB family transcriptional regulator, chromosome partitioning protein
MTSAQPPTRKALGRGLAALIPESAMPLSSTVANGYRELAIENISPNPDQPRKEFRMDALQELSVSIREQGVLQPLIVRKRGEGYEIVAGERRWRAAARAGLQSVPVMVKELSDRKALEIALVENIQRADLDPLEEALAYRQLLDEHDLTQDSLAKTLGKSRSALTNTLRLLKLPSSILSSITQGELSPGHARALLMVRDPNKQKELADDARHHSLSVRQVEARARAIGSENRKIKKPATSTPADQALEERLRRALGTKILLKHRNGKGTLQVSFHSYEHLDQILSQMGA